VCGGRVVDLAALQAATHYDDGYRQGSTAVRWFWEVRERCAGGLLPSLQALAAVCRGK
jgi:hypothetical protein